MSPQALEALRSNPSLEGLDLLGLADAADATEVLPRAPKGRWEHRHIALDNFNLIISRHGGEIGRASVDSWDDGVSHVVIIEDLDLPDSLNNHSGYLALLRQAAAAEPATSVIEGLPSNEMAAVTLDLDTFNLLPEGWQARYFRERGAELIELQYPFEIFDSLNDGEPVYHFLERVPEN